jgi:hypothetical protein
MELLLVLLLCWWLYVVGYFDVMLSVLLLLSRSFHDFFSIMFVYVGIIISSFDAGTTSAMIEATSRSRLLYTVVIIPHFLMLRPPSWMEAFLLQLWL